MIITISGTPGSGKSTLAKTLATKLNYPYLYMGEIRREVAARHGITLAELNALGETEAWTDLEPDEYLRTEAAKHKDAVIDSRVAFHFIPKSLKIFVSVAEPIGAERIYGALRKNPTKRNEGVGLNSLAEVAIANQRRIASDKMRYLKYYSVDYLDKKNYDLVLDTTNLTPEQSFDKLYTFVSHHQTM